jgi:hypothetical protein
MTHTFEFVVTKKQSQEDKDQGKEQEVLNLIYKTRSNRLHKVAAMIRSELATKKIVATGDIEDLYLRQIK